MYIVKRILQNSVPDFKFLDGGLKRGELSIIASGTGSPEDYGRRRTIGKRLISKSVFFDGFVYKIDYYDLIEVIMMEPDFKKYFSYYDEDDYE